MSTVKTKKDWLKISFNKCFSLTSKASLLVADSVVFGKRHPDSRRRTSRQVSRDPHHSLVCTVNGIRSPVAVVDRRGAVDAMRIFRVNWI